MPKAWNPGNRVQCTESMPKTLVRAEPPLYFLAEGYLAKASSVQWEKSDWQKSKTETKHFMFYSNPQHELMDSVARNVYIKHKSTAL